MDGAKSMIRGPRKKKPKMYLPYRGWIEINPWECGQCWDVKESFTVSNGKGKFLTIVAPFRCDYYTFAPNLKDPVPSIVHDFARINKLWDDGTPMTWGEWNALLYFLMKNSWDWKTRWLAPVYYLGAGSFDWITWNWGSKPETKK